MSPFPHLHLISFLFKRRLFRLSPVSTTSCSFLLLSINTRRGCPGCGSALSPLIGIQTTPARQTRSTQLTSPREEKKNLIMHDVKGFKEQICSYRHLSSQHFRVFTAGTKAARMDLIGSALIGRSRLRVNSLSEKCDMNKRERERKRHVQQGAGPDHCCG